MTISIRHVLPALSAVALILLTGCATTAPRSTAPDIEFFSSGGGPFSEAVRVGNLIFLAGKMGIGRDRPRGIKEETRTIMENIKSSLEAKGSGMDRVVKCTVFLADIAEWGAMNEVYSTYFPVNPPARSALGSSGLVGEGRVEIECIAVTGN